MIILDKKTPREIAEEIALNMKTRRKKKKLSQAALAIQSGVSLASIKRFENKFEISLMSLIKIGIILGAEDDFSALFKQKVYNSIQEVIDEQLQ